MTALEEYVTVSECDDTDDEIFIAASQEYEAICNPPDDCKDEEQFKDVVEDGFEDSDKRYIDLPSKRFASPVTEEELLKKIKDAVPYNTRKTTEWCVKAWQDWAKWRESSNADVPPQIDAGISNKEFSFWLPRFVV